MLVIQILGSLAFVASAIFYFIDWGSFAEAAQRIDAFRLMVLAGVVALVLVLAAVRWYVLVKPLGFLISFRRLATTTLIANGLNIAVPGAVAGDLFKALAITEGQGKSVGVALGSVAAERLVGLLALTITLATVFSISAAAEGQFNPWLVLGLSGLLLVVVLLLRLIVRGMDRKLPPGLGLARRLVSLAATTLGTLTAYRHRPLPLLLALLLAVAAHLLMCAGVWFFANSLAEVSFPGIALAVSLGFLAGIIPISVYGLGTRELIFVGVLSPLGFGTEAAILLSLLWFTLSVTVSLMLAGCAAVLDPRQIRSAVKVARDGLLGQRSAASRVPRGLHSEVPPAKQRESGVSHLMR